MYKILALTVLLCTNVFAQAANDVRVVGIISPPVFAGTPLGIPMSVVARLRNEGTKDQTNVKLRARLTYKDSIFYTDSLIIPYFEHGEDLDTIFPKDFFRTKKGEYEVCITLELPSDELPANNELCHPSYVSAQIDIKAIDITYPPPDTSFAKGAEIRITGHFVNLGFRDVYDHKAKAQVRRCSDGALVFQADSALPDLYRNAVVEMQFPSRQDSFDIRDLEPGCYKAAIITMGRDEGPDNDTLIRSFTILPNASVGDGSNREITLHTFPNPAATQTTIAFMLPNDGVVSLHLIDMTGKAHTLIAHEQLDAGEHVNTFDLAYLHPGIYRCELTFTDSDGTNYRSSKTIVVVK